VSDIRYDSRQFWQGDGKPTTATNLVPSIEVDSSAPAAVTTTKRDDRTDAELAEDLGRCIDKRWVHEAELILTELTTRLAEARSDLVFAHTMGTEYRDAANTLTSALAESRATLATCESFKKATEEAYTESR